MLFKGGICHQTRQNAVHCHLLLSTPSWWADADLGTFEIYGNPCRSGWPAWSGVRSSSCGTSAWRSTSATCGTSSTSSPTPSTSPPSASGYVLTTTWVLVLNFLTIVDVVFLWCTNHIYAPSSSWQEQGEKWGTYFLTHLSSFPDQKSVSNVLKKRPLLSLPFMLLVIEILFVHKP